MKQVVFPWGDFRPNFIMDRMLIVERRSNAIHGVTNYPEKGVSLGPPVYFLGVGQLDHMHHSNGLIGGSHFVGTLLFHFLQKLLMPWMPATPQKQDSSHIGKDRGSSSLAQVHTKEGPIVWKRVHPKG